jgi:uncharacterized protein
MPAPIGMLVVKITAHCNLDCSYCYEYRMGDESWRDKPRFLSDTLAATLARRIREHCQAWNLHAFTISFHGGEPLLMRPAGIARLVDIIRTEVGPGVTIHFGMQTNGMLITPELAQELAELRFSVGVSLDGPKRTNDRSRITRNGKSSFARTLRGIQALKSVGHPDLFAGILAVIDIEEDPLVTYDFLAQLDPPMIDFLLPHGTWEKPPKGKEGFDAVTPYGDWLVSIFDSWFSGNRADIAIRTFEEIIEHLAGGPGSLETLGLEPVSLLTIATDGGIEGVDTLKSVFPGAQTLGLNIATHSFDEALRHNMVAMRQAGIDALGEECARCSLVTICGGGYFPHRFAAATGFRNRSVYCADLFRLIGHIRARVLASIRVVDPTTARRIPAHHAVS